MDSLKTPFSSAEIYSILESEIVNLTLVPGQYLGEIDTAKRFAVSRTPIREVFKKLEYNNLVQILPQKGTMVLPINLRGISEFMFIRERIETGIIEGILKNRANIQLSALQIVLIKQRKLFEDESEDFAIRAKNFFVLDNTFHETLFEISNKSRLWKTFISYMPDYQRFRALHAEFITIENMHLLYEQHEDILNAIEQNDINKIYEIYKQHIYHGMANISELVQQKENYFVI